jgi:hypothetical protein
MAMPNWTDRFVGDQMAVDQEFSAEISDSEFTNQEWGLIMTAAEFDIENPSDPERARLVLRTDNLPGMLPELEKVRSGMGPGGVVGGDERPSDGDRSGGGLFDAIRGALGLEAADDDSEDQERLDAADRLVSKYAETIQDRLEAQGKWEGVRNAYLAESEAGSESASEST